MTITHIAMLLVVGWLPGAMLFRAPMLDRDGRAALDAEERAFWAVVLSITTTLAIVLALACLGQYSLERLLAANIAIAVVIGGRWRGRLRMPEAKRITFSAIVPLALVLFAGLRFLPPAEYIIGGKDPGVYVSEGIQIAQRGSLIINDTVVASVPAFARDLFIPQYTDFEGNVRTDYYSTRFMGFFVLDPETGRVVGQFPHLFPASIAIGYGIQGLTGALRTTTVWAVLGVLAVYFGGRRVFGTAAAASAAALLVLNVAEVWFARYPNSEVVMQALLFAALLAYARAQVDGLSFFAPIAGGVLGLLLFLRLDAGLAIAAVATAGLLGLMTRQAPRPSFWISLAVPSGLAAIYMLGPMRPHWHRYQVFLVNLGVVQYVAIGAVAVLLMAILLTARRTAATGTAIRRILPIALATVVVAAGLYALFLREPAGRLAAHDAYALRTFANLYFTVPGVLAGLLGFWLMARDRFWKDAALFLTVAIFAASVFYKIRIVPEHFWMARRFIPVILPGALLFVCAAAFSTAPAAWRGRPLRWAVGAVFVALLGGAFLRTSAPILHHIEYEGLIPRVEALADRFGANDLVLVESRDSGGDVHVLATPLAYIYARNVLVLASAKPDKAAMAAFVEWARTKYDRVFFVGGGGTDLVSQHFGIRPVVSERFEVPEFESTADRVPTRSARKFIFGVYEFVEPPRGDEAGWYQLDVGEHDDLQVLRFHSAEQSDRTTFRWTQRTSYVIVSSLPPGAAELTLVLNDGGRPPTAPPARLAVYVGTQRLGEIAVSPGPFRAYTLPLPPDLMARSASADEPLTLRLVSTVWNPHDLLGGPDDRQLGVMVDRVTIK
jgi:hypothetical protein